MYKRNSKILAALLTIVLVFSIFPSLRVNAAVVDSGTCGPDLAWTLDDAGTLTISGTGAMAGCSIGADFSGNLFTSAPWFAYKDSLTKIIIENGVTSIGESNFAYLSNVVNVTLPDSVTTIGDYAFVGCTSLTSITIPNSVTSIGDDAFENCRSLTSVTIPNSVTSIGYCAFSECTRLKSVTIGSGVTSISNDAFAYCTSLTSITIPNSVASIGDGAFFFCTNLTGITIPDSVTSIGDYAFAGCTSLTSITIPNSVTSIGEDAFEACDILTSITIPNSVTSIGEDAFYDCSKLQTTDNSINIDKALYDANKSAFPSFPDSSFNFTKYTITYGTPANGTVSGVAESLSATEITVTVAPNPNYVVDTVTVTDSTGTNTINPDTNNYYTFTMPSENVTIEATFKPIQKTVVFKNEDGTVLKSGAVDYGTNPAYTGATPAKAETDKYTYTFAGWSDGTKTYGPTDTLPAVTDDATYTAVFDSAVRTYTIKFVNEDGTVLQSGLVDYGTTPAYTGAPPAKAETDKYTYTFAGWTPAIASVTADATYTATFTKTAKPTPQTTPATTPATVSKPGTYYLSSMVEKDGNIVITIKMSEDDTKTFDLLGAVTSDGVALTEGNQYTAAKGSAIITINKSFLDTLAAGNHKLTVTFTDGGSITIDYEVKALAAAPQAAAQAVQATGEAVSAASIAGACLILTAAGIAITATRKREKEA